MLLEVEQTPASVGSFQNCFNDFWRYQYFIDPKRFEFTVGRDSLIRSTNRSKNTALIKNYWLAHGLWNANGGIGEALFKQNSKDCLEPLQESILLLEQEKKNIDSGSVLSFAISSSFYVT